MTPLSQRDKRWGSKKLGFSNVTIGGYGCLITCLAIQANTTPDKVNEILKANNGYANLNLVIWAEVNNIPGLEFEWRGWTYDNNKVLETIEKYGSCIVEVDFDGIVATPKDSHFVLFIGNKQLIDPWTGKIEPTSKYRIIKSYVIIKTKEEQMGDSSPELQECLRQHGQLVDETVKLKQELEDVRAEYKAQTDDFKREKERLTNEAEARNQEYKDFLADVAIAVGATQNESQVLSVLKSLVKNDEDAQKAIDTLREEEVKWNKIKIEMEGQVLKLKEQLKTKDLSKQDLEVLLRAIVRKLIDIARSR